MAHVAIERESVILVEIDISAKTREILDKEHINILVSHIVGALLRHAHSRNAVHPAIENSLCVCRIRDRHGGTRL